MTTHIDTSDEKVGIVITLGLQYLHIFVNIYKILNKYGSDRWIVIPLGTCDVTIMIYGKVHFPHSNVTLHKTCPNGLVFIWYPSII